MADNQYLIWTGGYKNLNQNGLSNETTETLQKLFKNLSIVKLHSSKRCRQTKKVVRFRGISMEHFSENLKIQWETYFGYSGFSFFFFFNFSVIQFFQTFHVHA